MRILVTGGAGFLGSHLVDRLLEQGDEVVVVDNFLTGRYVNLQHLEEHPRMRLVSHDLSKPLSDDVFAGPFQQIYNLASPASPRGYARYPIETQLVNSIGVLHVLELARRDDARFVQTSTSEVYGDPLIHPQVETYWGNVNPNGPRSCYDEGKRFAESLILEFVRQHHIDARLARIFNTYGPRSKPADGRVAPSFCMQALRGEPLTVYGDGSQTRSFCYVDDLIRGLTQLMNVDGIGGEIINIGNPAELTIKEFAETVLELTGARSEIIYEPLPIDDPTRRQPDITKAKRLLNWEPLVGLHDGLIPTLDYFRSML